MVQVRLLITHRSFNVHRVDSLCPVVQRGNSIVLFELAGSCSSNSCSGEVLLMDPPVAGSAGFGGLAWSSVPRQVPAATMS